MNRILEAQAPAVDLGITDDARKKTAKELEKVEADTFTLYLKTHFYHWNVTGPLFATLHTLFEEQYNALWTSVDAIAERIRALGAPAPGTYKQFTTTTSIMEDDGVPQADVMIRNLVEGHEAVVRTIRPVLEHAEDVHDQVTADLLTQQLQFHEKTAWMLRSLLE